MCTISMHLPRERERETQRHAEESSYLGLGLNPVLKEYPHINLLVVVSFIVQPWSASQNDPERGLTAVIYV